MEHSSSRHDDDALCKNTKPLMDRLPFSFSSLHVFIPPLSPSSSLPLTFLRFSGYEEVKPSRSSETRSSILTRSSMPRISNVMFDLICAILSLKTCHTNRQMRTQYMEIEKMRKGETGTWRRGRRRRRRRRKRRRRRSS